MFYSEKRKEGFLQTWMKANSKLNKMLQEKQKVGLYVNTTKLSSGFTADGFCSSKPKGIDMTSYQFSYLTGEWTLSSHPNLWREHIKEQLHDISFVVISTMPAIRTHLKVIEVCCTDYHKDVKIVWLQKSCKSVDDQSHSCQ